MEDLFNQFWSYFSGRVCMKLRNIFLLIVGAVILIAGTYYAYRWYDGIQKVKLERAVFEKKVRAWSDLKQKITMEINQFKGTTGVVVRDLDANWEITYNKDKLFPSASMAKIPIMAGTFKAAAEGRLKLDKVVKLKSNDKTSGSGILKDMHQGTSFTVEKLIGLMIYDSDNTATNMLINMVGIDYLNKSFKAFGLKHTNLSRKIADFLLRDRGVENYTTAEDMASILEKTYRKKLVNETVSEKCLKLLKLQQVNDRIPKYLPANVTVVHKTGLERSVCHDAGIVFTRKGDFIICVLTKHANSTSAASKEFIAKIAYHSYNYFKGLPGGAYG